MKAVLASTMFVFAACGGSSLDPGAGNDGGSGTKTLTVVGTMRAEPNLVNAQNFGEFTTAFSVRVTLDTQTVSTGTVEVTSISGKIPLTFVTNGENAGRWVGSAPGYDEVYVMDVTSGPDSVTGVRVDGPDIHTFTSPVANATMDSTQPMDITWTRDDTADTTSLRTDAIDALSITDTGTYQLQAGLLRAEKDKARENTIRITRTNRVTPVGAAGASEMSVVIANKITVLAQPNPAL